MLRILILVLFSQTLLAQNKDWWKKEIVYQIYPRSFQDSNNDGVGDLKGIISRLDYVKSLGITAVWINPFFVSPNVDNGYDIADYRGIQPEFGTMTDFDFLVKEMHKRDLKLIIDMVLNHSSDQHAWFKSAKTSRNSPYRNFYHWWPAEKGKPPYRYSLFDVNHDAWQFDSTTNAYYLHYFAKQQPDLNWSNPDLRKEIFEMMKFWAEKGVDGFRLDAFQFAAKDTSWPVFPEGFEKNFLQYYAMGNEIHDYLKEMNAEVFSKYKVMSVAEGAGRNFTEAHELVDADRKELNMAYAFEIVDIPNYKGYKVSDLKKAFTKWDSAFANKGWLSVFLSNHDQARMVSRFGNDSPAYRELSTKLLNTLILTMRGTPYTYYGDEIGMTNINFKSIKDYDDVSTKNEYTYLKNNGGDTLIFLERMKKTSRDNGRTPMQWSSDKNAGFSKAKPWLKVNGNHTVINVNKQEKNPNSVLNHFKKMTSLRANNQAFIEGKYSLIDSKNENVFAYTRTLENERFLVILNISSKPTDFAFNDTKGKVILNNYSNLNKAISLKKLLLRPYDALVIKY